MLSLWSNKVRFDRKIQLLKKTAEFDKKVMIKIAQATKTSTENSNLRRRKKVRKKILPISQLLIDYCWLQLATNSLYINL